MKSLHTRLDDQKEAVLSTTRKFGRFKAMAEFGISDYVCFDNWLEDITHEKNFGLRPQISLDGHQTLGDQLVTTFLCKVAQLQAQNKELRDQVEYLTEQLAMASEKEEIQSLAVLEVCQA
jgi:hypothetical protein